MSRAGGRQLPERLYPPDPAGTIARASAVAVSGVRLLTALVRQPAARELRGDRRTLPEMPGADFTALPGGGAGDGWLVRHPRPGLRLDPAARRAPDLRL